MSLSITVFLLHILAGSGPLELKGGEEEAERRPPEPMRATIHDGMNSDLEEDIRWLMK